MKLFNLKKAILGSAFGLITLGGVQLASAQIDDYRDYQRAQREAQREYMEYQRRPTRANYRDWQRAQAEAQREYNEYLRERNEDMYDGNRRVYTNRVYTTTTSPNRYYRVYRNGQSYQTDYRGAELLRSAVNQGYQQGFRQGQMDRQYGRSGGYYNSSVYRGGTYGYQSYVDRSQYQYYFQQGFQRGYEDGYNSRLRYGVRSGNGVNILGSILGTILNLATDNDY